MLETTIPMVVDVPALQIAAESSLMMLETVISL